MADKSAYKKILDKGDGVLSMVPNWVPRPFFSPGKRIRLHPDDYYAMGMKSGAIVERWFSSITKVETDESIENLGMSFVNVDGDMDKKVLFKDVIDALGEELIGKALFEKYGTWPMYSKFYDYNEPLFHHVHHREEACERVGVLPKHEHYFFPKQYNNHLGKRPITFFGFDPSVTREEIIERLSTFESQDGRILELSRGYQIELGTGWFTPAGVVHAPGSLCTYEPQWNSDVMALWENVVDGEIFDKTWLSNFLPEGKENDMDAIMDVADWDLNMLPNYREKFFRPPVLDQEGDGFTQNWVCYGNDYVAAKELTVEPGAEVTVSDGGAPFGCVVVQGRGEFGKFICESPTLIRYGQLTADEFYVSAGRSAEGLVVKNTSPVEPLVILKHFGPDCNMPQKK
jgi:hypothetical protein